MSRRSITSERQRLAHAVEPRQTRGVRERRHAVPSDSSRVRVALAVFALLASCGGGGSGPDPADFRERDHEQVDTDRAPNATDSPPNDSVNGTDSDAAPFTEPFPGSGNGGSSATTGGRPNPPSASGGRPNPPSASGGRPNPPNASGGRAATTGGRAGTTGGRAATTGGRAGTVPPTCNLAEGCLCGDDLCLACRCAYGEDDDICNNDCN
jgi:hypothetical protein